MEERIKNGTNPLYNVPRLKPLVQYFLVKHFWGPDFDLHRFKERKLIKHRERTINVIYRLQELPLVLQFYLEKGVFIFEQAYRQVFKWLDIYGELLCGEDDNEFKQCGCSDYYAPRYFTVDGEFNDVAWVKRYVNDKSKSPYICFLFDCYYCLEDEIHLHWQTLKRTGFDPFGAILDQNHYTMQFLVYLWIHKLENNLENLIQSPRPEYYFSCSIFSIGNVSEFWYVGFKNAVWKGHELATYYFWQHLSDTEKENFNQNDYTRLIIRAAWFGYYRIVYFLYYLLSNEQKNNLLERDTEVLYEKYVPLHKVWNCLIVSPFSQSKILQEIRDFRYPIPTKVYSQIIYNLTCSLKELKLPQIRESFRVLWQKLSEEDKLYCIENYRSSILKRLVIAEELDIAGLIIKGMSSNKRKDCLRNNWTGAGIGKLCALKKYSLLKKYLSFFFMQPDTEVIREDASSILLSLTQSPTYQVWLRNLNEGEKIEVNKVIYDLTYIIILEEANKVINALKDILLTLVSTNTLA